MGAAPAPTASRRCGATSRRLRAAAGAALASLAAADVPTTSVWAYDLLTDAVSPPASSLTVGVTSGSGSSITVSELALGFTFDSAGHPEWPSALPLNRFDVALALDPSLNALAPPVSWTVSLVAATPAGCVLASTGGTPCAPDTGTVLGSWSVTAGGAWGTGTADLTGLALSLTPDTPYFLWLPGTPATGSPAGAFSADLGLSPTGWATAAARSGSPGTYSAAAASAGSAAWGALTVATGAVAVEARLGYYVTPSATATATPSGTPTPSGSGTTTASGTPTPSGTPSGSGTTTVSGTVTASATPTPSGTPSGTGSGTASATASASEASTHTATPSGSGTPSGTRSMTATASPTATPSGTPTPTPTGSMTATTSGTLTATLTATLTPTGSPSGTATGSGSPSGTPSTSPSPSGSLVPPPGAVLAVLSLSPCNASALEAAGAAGWALRVAVAGAAGLNASDVALLGARCADGSGGAFLAFPADAPANAFTGGGSSRRASGSGGGAGGGFANASMLLTVEVTGLPAAAADLGGSSTGLPVAGGLSAADNVAGRIAAFGGAPLPAAYAAALGVSSAANASAVGAALNAVAAAWAAALGVPASDVTVGVASVAAPASSASPTPAAAAASPAKKSLAWVAAPVILGTLAVVVLVAALVAAHRRGAFKGRRAAAYASTPSAV